MTKPSKPTKTKKHRQQRADEQRYDDLWAAYAPIREEAKAASMYAFQLSSDGNATPEEKAAAWARSSELGQKRCDNHPDVILRRERSKENQ